VNTLLTIWTAVMMFDWWLWYVLKDEGSYQLRTEARQLLVELGSEWASELGWRDMWVFIARKGGTMTYCLCLLKTVRTGRTWCVNVDVLDWLSECVYETVVVQVCVLSRWKDSWAAQQDIKHDSLGWACRLACHCAATQALRLCTLHLSLLTYLLTRQSHWINIRSSKCCHQWWLCTNLTAAKLQVDNCGAYISFLGQRN